MNSLAINEITIVIPTYKYTKYLDKAIASALSLEFVKATIFVNINSLSDDYRQSLYWDSEVVNWRYIASPTNLPWESWNDAVNHSKGKRVIIVADDDLLCPNFFEGFDLSEFSNETIFLSRLNMVDRDVIFM
jgi:glycosyltransferase involved in cell wall biosynthesis